MVCNEFFKTSPEKCKGISDPLNYGKTVASVKLIDNNGVAETKINTSSTTQHLKREQGPDGTLKDSYATTTFAILPTTTYPYHDYEYKSGSKWDQYGGLLVYSTTYYDEYYKDALDVYVQHYRTAGSWEIHDSLYRLTSRTVTMGVNGKSLNGQLVSQTVPVPFSGLSFDYTTYSLPSIFYNVGFNLDDLGTTIYTRITRGTSSWDFWVMNNIIGPSDI